MSANKNLNKAKSAKMDEFYTRREDIEAELLHYKAFFEGKVVYCNCDDPTWSEFWQFFVRVFRDWKIKKLMATHYEPNEKNYAYKLELTEDTNGDGKIDWQDEPTITQIPCNGDFRSAICIEFLKEADIVVTNPPFSLIREYIAQLMEYDKSFLIIGPLNAVKYKETFPLLRENKMWVGYSHPKMFRIPDDAVGKNVIEDGGVRYQKFGNVQWYTNLDIDKRHVILDLRGNYYDAEKYPTYDNLDAIDVSKVSDIPCDYDGLMGVPISILDNYNPDQFELIGMGTGDTAKEIGVTKNYRGRTDLAITVIGKSKCPFTRIVIKNKHPEERRYPDED